MIDTAPADRVFARPMLLDPRASAAAVATLSRPKPAAATLRQSPDPFQPGFVALGPVAVITVQGLLLRAHPWGAMQPCWGITGYDGIAAALRLALADPAVRAIALHIDSPGGECAGLFDLSAEITAARGAKPIAAVLDEVAYSAAYAIACCADSISVPRTGGVGSIGVVAVHTEYSGALAKEGIGVNVITYGDRKADGNPYQPLADAARAAFQADVNALGEMFVDLVASNRRLSADAVRAQQAACFMGPAAVMAGLADTVLSAEPAMQALLAAAAA